MVKKKRGILATAALAVLVAHPVHAAEPDYRAMALRAVDAVAVPAYARFGERAAALAKDAEAFCARPPGDDPAPLRARFHESMDAWQSVQVVGYGPVEEFNRGQRIHFWPDKKNSGDRQMRQLIKEGKAESLEGGRIAFASVAIQGLPALETLLFAEQGLSGPDGAFRCRLVTAIGINLAHMGEAIVKAWDGPEGYRAKIDQAGGPASPYVDHRQAASQAFNAIHAHLEAVSEVKLAYPLGASADMARKQKAESWRSERSLRNIRLNLAAVRAMAQAALVPELTPDTAAQLMAAIDAAEASAAQVPGTLEAAIETEAGWKALGELKVKVKAIARVLEAKAGAELGLQVGFNALDGD